MSKYNDARSLNFEILGLFVIPSWFEYLAFSLLKTIVLKYAISLHTSSSSITQGPSLFSSLVMLTPALAILTFTFSLFEKLKKEQFIIGITNSKTKKQLLQLLNQMTHPVALVSKKGQVVFCNV